jgi:hypothetical protein
VDIGDQYREIRPLIRPCAMIVQSASSGSTLGLLRKRRMQKSMPFSARFLQE